jgi:hypothetical protein
VNNLRTAVGAEYQPQATTVAFVEPPVSPAPANHLVAAAPVPAPAPIVAPVAPAPPPAQAVVPAPAPQPEQPTLQAETVVPQSEETVAVFLHLSSGERIWAGRFASSELADQRASEIVRALNRPEPGVWAKFGNRLIRPEAVVSIELAQRRED